MRESHGMKRNLLLYKITKKMAQIVFSIFYRIEKTHAALHSEKGPMIILPKHQYWTDIPIISLSFKPFLYFVAKRELFKYPLIRTYLTCLGGLPVDRKQTIRTLNSFKTIHSLLKKGERIVIFPEGTYFRKEVGGGKVRLLQMILRWQSEIGGIIPFIPVGIRYGRRSRWRREVEVCIGEPLYAEKESEANTLVHQAMEEISRLSRLPKWTESISGDELREYFKF